MDALNAKEISEAYFVEAAEIWLATQYFHMATRTRCDYTRYLANLTQHFGCQKLSEITGDDVRAYQQMRITTAGPGTINKELGVLIQMRKRTGVPLTDYQRLPVPKRGNVPSSNLERSSSSQPQ